jgi:hypothetical protein
VASLAGAQAPKTAIRPFLRALRRAPWLEELAVLVGAFLATLYAEWRIVANPVAFNQDAQIHNFWMRRFQDPALFDDPLTDALVATGYQPLGFRSAFWLVSHAIDPVTFGEVLPLVLQPLSVWIVFRIVRMHTSWRPAAWLAAALFILPWDILRFSGGHPRAFAQPILLLTVFLLLRRRNLAAAAVPPVGVLFYPPAGLTAVAIVALASLDLGRARRVNARRLAYAAGSVAALAVAVLVPQLLADASQDLISAAEARRYPEFGPQGRMHYFAPTTLAYLKHNYSGFFLRDSGSILAVAALLLLIVRPRNALLFRWEVWCMPIASLGLFAAAHALLFRLYLPHRYTYALLPFFCVAVAVALRPSLAALAARSRVALFAAPALPFAVALFALTAFPLGPQLSLTRLEAWLAGAAPLLAVGLAVGLLLAAAVWAIRTGQDAVHMAASAAALVAGSLLVGAVAFAGGGKSNASACKEAELYSHLRTLPKDAVVAGDPVNLNCIPLAARRPVVISQKLYQPWNPAYFAIIRPRMFDMVRGYYGPSVAGLTELRRRYGADYVVVRTRVRKRAWRGMAPFTAQLNRLLRTVAVPAALRLPASCRTWRGQKFQVYDLACVAREQAVATLGLPSQDGGRRVASRVPPAVARLAVS